MEVHDFTRLLTDYYTRFDKILDIKILKTLEEGQYLIKLDGKLLKAFIRGEKLSEGFYKVKLVELRPKLTFGIFNNDIGGVKKESIFTEKTPLTSGKNGFDSHVSTLSSAQISKGLNFLHLKETDINKLLEIMNIIKEKITNSLQTAISKHGVDPIVDASGFKELLNVQNINMQIQQLIYNNALVLYFLAPRLNILDGRISIKKIKHNYYRLVMDLFFSNLGYVFVAINCIDNICDVTIKSDVDISEKIHCINIPDVIIKWRLLETKNGDCEKELEINKLNLFI